MISVEQIEKRIKELEDGLNQTLHNHGKILGMIEQAKWFLDLAQSAANKIEDAPQTENGSDISSS